MYLSRVARRVVNMRTLSRIDWPDFNKNVLNGRKKAEKKWAVGCKPTAHSSQKAASVRR